VQARPLHFVRREIEMASQIERVGNVADQVENIGANSATSLDDAGDSQYPVASWLVLGAVVIGGGLLVAMLRDHGAEDGLGEFRGPRRLAAVSAMSPKVIETVSRVRDAAFSFALAKAVDTVDEIFPGFREHYERA
jgi:hypothetical protein